MEKCIGCELCAGVCPARCIYVRGADNPTDDPVSPGERYGFVYEINYLRCIHCDLCVEACPTEAITETKLFEFSFTNRGRCDLHEGTTSRRRRRPRPAAAVGAVARGRGRAHERVDARRRRRRGPPRTKAGSTGRASSASVCARPNPASTPRRGSGRTTSGSRHLLRLCGRGARRRVRRDPRPQPGALRAVPLGHAGQHRGALPPAGRRPRRRDPDHRVRERDRRVVPLRHHVARRRPHEALDDPHPLQRAGRDRLGVLLLVGVLVLGRATNGSRARTPRGRARRSARAATCKTSPRACSPTSSGRSRSPRCCS